MLEAMLLVKLFCDMKTISLPIDILLIQKIVKHIFLTIEVGLKSISKEKIQETDKQERPNQYSKHHLM
jgi:hypothetical protein